MSNESKEILVTGASKGIGQGIAIHLASSGYKVLVHYGRDEKGACETAETIEKNGGTASIIGFNVTNREETRETLEKYITDNGCFYGIVNNAGIAKDTAFPAMTDDEWDSVIDTNLNGFYNVVRPCILPMVRARKPGRIVAITSVSGLMGNRGQVNYSASKSGVIGAVKALSLEVAKRNITVNCVAPGIIETEMISDEIWQHAKHIVPMQRKGSVRDVSSVVNFLMSEDANYITRQVISVNGGIV